MWPDRVSNPGPLSLESDPSLTVPRIPAKGKESKCVIDNNSEVTNGIDVLLLLCYRLFTDLTC